MPPASASPANPFAPPGAAIGPPLEPEVVGGLGAVSDGEREDVTRLFLRWEAARLGVNVALTAAYVAVMYGGRIADPIPGVVALLLLAVALNLACCGGPLLPRPEWRGRVAAGLFATIGVAATAVATALVLGGVLPFEDG